MSYRYYVAEVANVVSDNTHKLENAYAFEFDGAVDPSVMSDYCNRMIDAGLITEYRIYKPISSAWKQSNKDKALTELVMTKLEEIEAR